MNIEVLRIGQRIVRDDRVTTHVALVSRAFGARRIFMDEVNPDIVQTVAGVNETWGGSFQVELVEDWRRLLQSKKDSSSIIHLTMYGQELDSTLDAIRTERDILVIVGAGKVPREVYDLADYNVSVGSQPHSEISALAVLLDRVQQGRQFSREYPGARRTIVPDGREKNVRVDKTRD